MTVTITETKARTFRSDGCTAFTLVNGQIVGRVPANGRKVPYAVQVLDVLRVYISEANQQELDVMERLIQERRK